MICGDVTRGAEFGVANDRFPTALSTVGADGSVRRIVNPIFKLQTFFSAAFTNHNGFYFTFRRGSSLAMHCAFVVLDFQIVS